MCRPTAGATKVGPTAFVARATFLPPQHPCGFESSLCACLVRCWFGLVWFVSFGLLVGSFLLLLTPAVVFTPSGPSGPAFFPLWSCCCASFGFIAPVVVLGEVMTTVINDISNRHFQLNDINQDNKSHMSMSYICRSHSARKAPFSRLLVCSHTLPNATTSTKQPLNIDDRATTSLAHTPLPCPALPASTDTPRSLTHPFLLIGVCVILNCFIVLPLSLSLTHTHIQTLPTITSGPRLDCLIDCLID